MMRWLGARFGLSFPEQVVNLCFEVSDIVGVVQDVGVCEELALEVSANFAVDGAVRWVLVAINLIDERASLKDCVDEACNAVGLVCRFQGRESFMKSSQSVDGCSFVVVAEYFPGVGACGFRGC